MAEQNVQHYEGVPVEQVKRDAEKYTDSKIIRLSEIRGFLFCPDWVNPFHRLH